MNAPPLLISFNYVDKFLEALPEKQRKRYSNEVIDLITQTYPPVVSPYCLAVMFGYSLQFVHALSSKQHKFYRSFDIRQGKKVRRIYSPRVALKVIQKWFGHHLSNALDFPPHICGFVKGRSFADAAKQHIGASWIYSIDIKDFFPSISEENVAESLVKLGYSDQGAKLIAALCCLNGALAQGSPASPVLSNLYMREIDKTLLGIAQKNSFKVTRYADDIVFSGTEGFNENLSVELEKVFDGTALQLNTNKTFFADQLKGQRLKVHGLLVKEDKITLTKGYRNKLRAYKHMLDSGKVCENDIARLTGHVTFAEFIEK
jgi:RNA-directed DNA polymerase